MHRFEKCKEENCHVKKNANKIVAGENAKSIDLTIHDRERTHYLDIEIKTKKQYKNQIDLDRITCLTCKSDNRKSACFIELHISDKGEKSCCKLFFIEKGYVKTILTTNLNYKKDGGLTWLDVTQSKYARYNVWGNDEYDLRIDITQFPK